MKRAGYWISEKKSKKQNFEDAKEKYREAGIELVKIDLNVDFEKQGPFDLIIHKTTDLLVKADLGDSDAINITKQFKDYAVNHPNCIMLDPMDNVYRLLDRYEQYNIVEDCIRKDSESDIFIPSFVILSTTDIEVNKRKLKQARVTYPIVVKPILAHGTRISHQMSIVFNDNGLRDVQPPCVAQRFVNHNAVLYKVYVIGDKQFIVDRPSLKNFHSSDKDTIFFDTHEVSKADSSHILNELDASDQGNSPLKPDIRKLEELGENLRSAFGLDLLGVDVIIECDTKRYGVIDINAFPATKDYLKNDSLKLDNLIKDSTLTSTAIMAELGILITDDKVDQDIIIENPVKPLPSVSVNRKRKQQTAKSKDIKKTTKEGETGPKKDKKEENKVKEEKKKRQLAAIEASKMMARKIVQHSKPSKTTATPILFQTTPAPAIQSTTPAPTNSLKTTPAAPTIPAKTTSDPTITLQTTPASTIPLQTSSASMITPLQTTPATTILLQKTPANTVTLKTTPANMIMLKTTSDPTISLHSDTASASTITSLQITPDLTIPLQMTPAATTPIRTTPAPMTPTTTTPTTTTPLRMTPTTTTPLRMTPTTTTPLRMTPTTATPPGMTPTTTTPLRMTPTTTTPLRMTPTTTTPLRMKPTATTPLRTTPAARMPTPKAHEATNQPLISHVAEMQPLVIDSLAEIQLPNNWLDCLHEANNALNDFESVSISDDPHHECRKRIRQLEQKVEFLEGQLLKDFLAKLTENASQSKMQTEGGNCLLDTQETTEDPSTAKENITPMKDSQMVELVPGYGVQLTLNQLNACVRKSKGSATALTRLLLVVFFDLKTLSERCARGTSADRMALPANIVDAIIRYDGNNINFFDVLLDHMLTLLKVPRSSKVKVTPDQLKFSLNSDSGRKTNATSDDLLESCIKRLKSDPSSGMAVDSGSHNHESANNNICHYAVNGSSADHREPFREFPASLHGKPICNGHAVGEGGERPQT